MIKEVFGTSSFQRNAMKATYEVILEKTALPSKMVAKSCMLGEVLHVGNRVAIVGGHAVRNMMKATYEVILEKTVLPSKMAVKSCMLGIG